MPDIPEPLDKLATWILQNCDPGFDSYWIRHGIPADPHRPSNLQPTAWNPGDSWFNFVFDTRTQDSAPVGGTEKSRAYYLTNEPAPALAYYPLTRFAVATLNSIWLLVRPTAAPPIDKYAQRVPIIADTVTNPSGEFTFTPAFPPSFMVPTNQDYSGSAPQPPIPSGLEGFGVMFRYRGLGTVPFFKPMPPRKPRKWGRVLTPKWEAEHAQIVAQRKFKRNVKKAKEGKLDRFEGYPTLKAQCDVKTIEAHLQTRAAMLRRMDALINRTTNGNRRATLRNAKRALMKLVKGVKPRKVIKRIKRKT